MFVVPRSELPASSTAADVAAEPEPDSESNSESDAPYTPYDASAPPPYPPVAATGSVQ